MPSPATEVGAPLSDPLGRETGIAPALDPADRFIDTAAVMPWPWLRRAYRPVQPLVEAAFEFPALWRLYGHCRSTGRQGAAFAGEALDRLGVTWTIPPGDLARLQAIKGPIVLVCNHAFGGLDSLAIVQLIEMLRPGSWRMLSNEIVCALPEFADRMIPVDPLGRGEASLRLNARGMRMALRFLHRPDALLAFFPAGRVSGRDRRLGGVVCDRPWSEHTARLAVKAGATVVCLHIPHGNSRRFLAVPRHWSRLRALMLCRELVRPPVDRVEVRLAALLPEPDMRRWAGSPNPGARLRALCYLRADADTARPTSPLQPGEGLQPLDPAPPPTDVEAEVALLRETAVRPAGCGDDVDLLLFRGAQAPTLLRLLGLAREATFRAAGQGAGGGCDLSPEDEYYHHLVLWDRNRQSVMGAYRLGFTEQILATHGPKGLYLDHVFAIDPGFYRRLGPAIELSRSFVVPAYQRDSRALALLWQGLGNAALRHQCRTLFGSVTISNQHHPATRAVLVEHLRRNHADDPALRRLVKARQPFVPVTRYHELVGEAYSGSGLESLTPLIAQIEEGARGIPPLMRYYCSLGARFLAYHVEAGFQDALYCLLRVDLEAIPEAYRRRFLR